MAGKWQFLKGQVPEKTNDEQPGYRERYAKLAALYKDHTLPALAEELTKAREIKDEFMGQLAEANLEVTVRERLIIEKLEALGIDSITAGGYKLTPSPEPVFSKRDGAALRQWCSETGQEELLTVNAQTLSSLAKQVYLDDGMPPPGVELTGVYTKLSRTKAK
jgi:hypothetical protein